MQIVMIDDSVPYDGFTALSKPLGGGQKAFASLAGALAKSGNRVTVINRCKHAIMAEGARWRSLDSDIPRDADLLIALRNPELLSLVSRVDTRVLWVVDDPIYLGNTKNADILASFAPRLLFISNRQAERYGGRLPALVVPPGVNKSFLPDSDSINPFPDSNHAEMALDESEEEQNEENIQPPTAIVTTHPLYSLSRVIKLWKDRITSELPNSKLKIFSSILYRGIEGNQIPGSYSEILSLVKESEGSGIEIVAPMGDRDMANEYKNARVHLYYGHEKDFSCWTLRDSQSSGLPAVGRSLGGVEDVIENSKSGYIVPDDDAFANLTLQILSDDKIYSMLNDGSSRVLKQRTWAEAANTVAQIWL